jgi:hypothetical protein
VDSAAAVVAVAKAAAVVLAVSAAIIATNQDRGLRSGKGRRPRDAALFQFRRDGEEK